jgi:hypothetical protein
MTNEFFSREDPGDDWQSQRDWLHFTGRCWPDVCSVCFLIAEKAKKEEEKNDHK